VVNTFDKHLIEVIHQKSIKIPIIAVTGGKGGVGKSTVAVNIADAIVQMGYKVALVDADVDAPNDHILLDIPLENSIEVINTLPLINYGRCTKCRKCVDICRRNALFQPENSFPILIGECNGCEACILICPSDAIDRGKRILGKVYMSKRDGLTLFTGEIVPGAEESAFVVNALKNRVFEEANDLDIIIVDTSPGTHCNVINAVRAVDIAFAVTEPTPLGIHDLKLILKLLKKLQIESKIVLNRSDLPGPKGQINFIAKAYDSNIIVDIPMDDELLKSYIIGIPVVRMYPKALSSIKFFNMAKEIVERFLQ